MKEEEEEEEVPNGFDDWETLHYTRYRHSPPPSSSYSSSSRSLSPTHHDLSIFPPVNHEGLPISPSTPDLSNSPSPPPPPGPPPRNSQLVSWFDLALHFWNSKLLSILTRLRSSGFLSLLRPVAAVASILAVFWFWVRRWSNRRGGDQRVEQLQLLIKEKDEKILRLLEQISELNKALITRHRVPVLKSS